MVTTPCEPRSGFVGECFKKWLDHVHLKTFHISDLGPCGEESLGLLVGEHFAELANPICAVAQGHERLGRLFSFQRSHVLKPRVIHLCLGHAARYVGEYLWGHGL